MKIKDVMTRGVECTRPESNIQDVAKRMAELNVGIIPVCGDGEKLVGMVTDRDITIRAVAAGRDPRSTRATDVMTPEVHYCFEDSDVEDCVDLMKERQVRRIVVLDRNKRLVGIVSLGDLAVETNDKLSGDALEAISEPSQPQR